VFNVGSGSHDRGWCIQHGRWLGVCMKWQQLLAVPFRVGALLSSNNIVRTHASIFSPRRSRAYHTWSGRSLSGCLRKPLKFVLSSFGSTHHCPMLHLCCLPVLTAPGWTPGASTLPQPCLGSWWCLHNSLLHPSRCHMLSGHSCAAATPMSSLCWLCLCRRCSTNAAGGLSYTLLPAHPALRCCRHSTGYLIQARPPGGGGCMMGTRTLCLMIAPSPGWFWSAALAGLGHGTSCRLYQQLHQPVCSTGQVPDRGSGILGGTK
jgi:hypothetical protein